MNPLSIYIHWPFCAAKCPYCDFNSRPITSSLDEQVWERAYLGELSHYAQLLPDREITTVYFGGGTPSLMRPQTIAAIINKIAALWKVQHFCEITIEANPSSSEIGKFQAFNSAGVNRISLGVQALDDEDLRFLGRTHDKNAAREAIEIAAKTFDRYTFDLIYARRNQTPIAWERELREAISFGSRHLSLYQLTIEEGTVFHKRARHEILQANEDDAAAMYELTDDLMVAAGLPLYEISNYAAAGQESRHNLTYWNYDDYIGVGPGAHGRFVVDNAVRLATENIAQPDAWLQQTLQQSHGVIQSEPIALQTARHEALMMGLRLASGIDLKKWHEKFVDPFTSFVPVEKLQKLASENLLVFDGTVCAATRAGRQRLNSVLNYLWSGLYP